MKLKVFGIGMPKTGTSSLGNALETLGFSLGRRDYEPWRNDDWNWIDESAEADDCFEDWPWPLVYREMDQRYPDAKFILTVRASAETWHDSITTHVRNYGPSDSFSDYFGYVYPQNNPEHFMRTYRAHNAAVKAYFRDRPDKLLTVCWETGDGWAELCAFLDRPQPDVRFPHVNKRHGLLKRARRRLRRRLYDLLVSTPAAE